MVRQVIHEIPLQALLRGPAGAVAKDMLKRGYRVQARARKLISGAGPGHPKRVDTGATRSSIQVTLLGGVDLRVRIGSKLIRAIWIHDGTGIYGPRHRPIRPRSAKYLKFKPKGSKYYVYAKSVKGMRPNRFLKDALPAANSKTSV
jgi:hypothetical protein